MWFQAPVAPRRTNGQTARLEPFGGLKVMTHFYLYLSIILLAKALTLAVVALIRQRRRPEGLHRGVPETVTDLEPFTCLKADLKQVNDGAFLCHMRFANQGVRSLLAREEAGRIISG